MAEEVAVAQVELDALTGAFLGAFTNKHGRPDVDGLYRLLLPQVVVTKRTGAVCEVYDLKQIIEPRRQLAHERIAWGFLRGGDGGAHGHLRWDRAALLLLPQGRRSRRPTLCRTRREDDPVRPRRRRMEDQRPGLGGRVGGSAAVGDPAPGSGVQDGPMARGSVLQRPCQRVAFPPGGQFYFPEWSAVVVEPSLAGTFPSRWTTSILGRNGITRSTTAEVPEFSKIMPAKL